MLKYFSIYKMSINHLTRVVEGQKMGLEIGCALLCSTNLETTSHTTTDLTVEKLVVTDSSIVKTQDGNDLEYRTATVGTAGYTLHSDGVGGVEWQPSVAGSGNIVYNGAPFTPVGRHLKASATGYSTANESALLETATQLSFGGLDLEQTGTINGVNIVAVSNATTANTNNITSLKDDRLKLDGTLPMSGNLDVGGNSITNVSLVDGIDIVALDGSVTANQSLIGTNASNISTNQSAIAVIDAALVTAVQDINVNSIAIGLKLNSDGTTPMGGDLNLNSNSVTGVFNQYIGNFQNMAHIATPATPSTGTNSLYFKSDMNLYTKDPTGNERGIVAAPVGAYVEYDNAAPTTVGQHLIFDNTVGSLVNQSAIVEDVNTINMATKVVEVGNAIVAGQIPTPANPAALKNSLYFKSDDILYSLTSAGVEAPVGGGLGDVVGPTSSDDSTVAFFDGASGKLLKDVAGFKFQTGLTYGDQLAIPDIQTADHLSLNGELAKITNITSAVQLPAPITTMAGVLDVKTIRSAVQGGELDFNAGTATLDAGAVVLNGTTDVNIEISSINKVAITPFETTISTDLKTDIIKKNTDDKVTIEDSQFRTGGLLNVNELQISDAIDVSSNVISSVGAGVALTDAVNKGQLDTKIDLAQKGAANGVCPLDNSLPQAKIPTQYLPDLVISQVYVVADNIARDNIASVQMGDVAVVISPANNFIWSGPHENAPLTASNWVQLIVPTGTVVEVNGQTGTVTLTTNEVPETVLNPYFTDLRRDELINRSGTVAMTGNLNMGTSNIVDCNMVINGGGDLTLQSSSAVQVAAVTKINLNTAGSVEIPSCNLDMLGNQIVGATQITTGALEVVSLGSGILSPNINVFSDLSMSAGSNIAMSGNNITNAGTVALDTLSSATATSIAVNHDLVMASGEFIYTDALVGLPGPSPIIQIGADLVMGSKGVIAGDYTLDSTGLSSTSNLDIVANVGASSITLDSNTAVSIPNCNLDMVGRQIIGCSVLDGASMTVQSFGTLTLKTNSGGDVNIEPVQRCNINAPNNLWVNGIQQDTNKSAWASMLRPDYSILNIASGTFPLLPYTGTPPNGGAVVKNMTADPANMLVTSQIGGYYKFDASFECNTGANAGSVLMLIYINGIPFFQTESFIMKSVWSTHSITYIDRVDRPPGTTYGVRCQAVGGAIDVRQASFNLVRLTDNT
jgi:hypothetical protein